MLITALLVVSACLSAAAVKDGAMTKVDPDLRALYDSYIAEERHQDTSTKPGTPPLVQIVEDRVVIDAVSSGDVQALKADLMTLGMQEAVAVGRIVSGQLPIRAIGALDGLASLQFARPAYSTTRMAPPRRP